MAPDDAIEQASETPMSGGWIGDLVERFRAFAGRSPDGLWRAPGRVNLIGEHTDYNDGFVLPFAIDRHATAAIARRDDGLVRCASRQLDETVETLLAQVSPQQRPGGWAAYALGVAWALQQDGVEVGGFDLVIDSDVPSGAGMSSSAALESAVALGLTELAGTESDRPALARVGRRAENEIVGAPTGVMDQMASLCATSDHALFLDCRSMSTEQIPLDLVTAGLVILVMDTRTAHRHSDGEYVARRSSCERVADALGAPALRDVTVSQVDNVLDVDPVDRRRARHVVTENDRVLRTVEVLRTGDIRAIGEFLTASHVSMRDDFAISTEQLDTAVDTALATGAFGARMTGGGFGGAAIALVDTARAGAVAGAVRTAFADRRFTEPDITTVRPAGGATRVRVED